MCWTRWNGTACNKLLQGFKPQTYGSVGNSGFKPKSPENPVKIALYAILSQFASVCDGLRKNASSCGFPARCAEDSAPLFRHDVLPLAL
jgi:hypothetical protein